MFDIDQVYLISKSVDIKLNHSFVEIYGDKLTPLIVNDYVIDNHLTRGLIEHLDTITSLTLDHFDWQYYLAKYPEIDKHLNKHDVWKYWTEIGIPQHHNPINMCSVNHRDDASILLCLLQVFVDSLDKHYEKILVINAATDKQYVPDFNNEILSNLISVITVNDVCIFTNNQVNYAYVIDKKLYLPLLVELSYFIYNFDEILVSYISHNNIPYQIFEYTTQSYQDLDTFSLNNPLEVSEDCSKIIRLRRKFLKQRYVEFLKKYQIDAADKAKIDHIIKQYSFDLIKSKWNSDLRLDEENYFFLCQNINKFNYFTKLKIKDSSTKLCEPNIIYFDREFYLRTYPCYRNVFKNYNDAFAHYVNHGISERLLSNNAIFTLTKCCQDYLLDQMLNPMPPNINYHENDPLIYILTRTCNREHLFTQCVESLLAQQYPNLRHIVSYDNAETHQYIKKFQHIYDIVDLTSKKLKIHPNEYIDYLYDHIPPKEPGWVLVLDDDDKFMTPYGLHYLKNYLANDKSLIIWMLYRPDKFIYPANKSAPVVGEIGSCCYLYHTSTIQKNCWGPGGIGDYPCFRRLFSRLRDHIYIDLPLTGINYEQQVSGWTAS